VLHRLLPERQSTDYNLKPRSHQQQCRSNIVERYKLNDSFDSVECCFEIVAVFGNNVAGFGNNVERNFVISTKSKQIERVQFVSTLSKGGNCVRHCCRLWQKSRTLLRQCCWCGRGLRSRRRYRTRLANTDRRNFLYTDWLLKICFSLVSTSYFYIFLVMLILVCELSIVCLRIVCVC